jgi:hypothetical protein
LQLDLVIGKFANAYLGTLQVHQDTHLAAMGTRPVAYFFSALAVLVGVAMGEIQSHHIDAGLDDFVQYFGIVRSRT